MLHSSTQIANEIPLPAGVRANDVQELHVRCGVYTQPALVRRTLDVCGWTSQANLSRASLLEPCAGDGSFLTEAVRRLMQSLKRCRIVPSSKLLKSKILAFELVAAEATKARHALVVLLVTHGVGKSTADAVAKAWVKTGDFLLNRPKRRRFTHVVGNPPYVRWSKVPKTLRSKYEASLLPAIARGDLQLPFLSEGVSALSDGGRLAFVCSDRWRHMNYGAAFKADLLQRARVKINRITERPSFSRRVGAYADLLLVTNVAPVVRLSKPAVLKRKCTLSEFGCSIRVGPALGCERAYVGSTAELRVESELLTRFVRPKQIREGEVITEDLWIVVMHDALGRLRELRDYPRLATHFDDYADRLRTRSIVSTGGIWYRPIDRVQKERWAPPKLLLPEIAKVPRIAMDRSGAIPSHGVYAIFGPEDRLGNINSQLANGGLEAALRPIAPSLNGGYLRCYRRFLEQIEINL